MRHALPHLPGAPVSSQDDAHAPDRLGHCGLCHIWELLDATLPASFVPLTGNASRLAPPAPAPRGTTIAVLPWFQSRAPPATA